MAERAPGDRPARQPGGVSPSRLPSLGAPVLSALTSIRDLLAGGGEVSPYLPHWRGDTVFQSEQRVRRLLNLRRTKKRSAAQEEELERIRAELAAGAEGSV
jgi:hypothetical protein